MRSQEIQTLPNLVSDLIGGHYKKFLYVVLVLTRYKWISTFRDLPDSADSMLLAPISALTLRRIGSTLGALRLCCTNSMANRYKLRYQCISTLTSGTGTSGIGTF